MRGKLDVLLAVASLAVVGCGSDTSAVAQGETTGDAELAGQIAALEKRIVQLEMAVASLWQREAVPSNVIGKYRFDFGVLSEIDLSELRSCLNDLEDGRSSLACGRVVR